MWTDEINTNKDSQDTADPVESTDIPVGGLGRQINR